MAYHYNRDQYARACLRLARQSRSHVGFGAVLVRNNTIVAGGRNRRSQPGEHELLRGGVDYATHAEQAAIVWAIKSDVALSDLKMYVLGEIQTGQRAKMISVKSSDAQKEFTCVRCAKTLVRFALPVHVPLPSGWLRLEPEEALASAKYFRDHSQQRQFTTPS